MLAQILDASPNEIKLREATYSSLLRKLPHSKIAPPADQATHAVDHERSSHSNQSQIRLFHAIVHNIIYGLLN